MSGCEKCHGTGEIDCPKCGGEKGVKYKCTVCGGKGKLDTCSKCNGTGLLSRECRRCHGSGDKVSICPVCNHGKITKTRLINCAHCFGTGKERDSDGHYHRCYRCDGRGQVHEEYKEICPNCHGNYKKKIGDCECCKGTGDIYYDCDNCGGTGHATCKDCKGSGEVVCSDCNGTGKIKCPDCEKRERKIREQQESERRKREASRRRKMRRWKTIRWYIGFMSVVSAIGFLGWWWWEGLTTSALTDMLEQAKSAIISEYGILGIVAKVCGGFIVSILLFKAIMGNVNEESTSETRRWKFVLMGLLIGGVGAHLAYIERKKLCLLHWVPFVLAFAFTTDTVSALTKPLEELLKQSCGEHALCNIMAGAWLLVWTSCMLFIKRDGDGKRM